MSEEIENLRNLSGGDEPVLSEMDCNCHNVHEYMVEVMKDELDPAMAKKFRDHIQDCPTCAEESGRVKRYIEKLQESCQCEAPGGLQDRIMARIHSEH